MHACVTANTGFWIMVATERGLCVDGAHYAGLGHPHTIITVVPHVQTYTRPSRSSVCTCNVTLMKWKWSEYEANINYQFHYYIWIPAANLFSKSVLPMALAAWHICLSSSSSLLIQRMMLPSKTSVILQMCEKAAPCVKE